MTITVNQNEQSKKIKDSQIVFYFEKSTNLSVLENLDKYDNIDIFETPCSNYNEFNVSNRNFNETQKNKINPFQQ